MPSARRVYLRQVVQHDQRGGASDRLSSMSSPQPTLACDILAWQDFGLELTPKETNDSLGRLTDSKEVAQCRLSRERVRRPLGADLHDQYRLRKPPRQGKRNGGVSAV
jgi:hypothetical protein